jgi:hypothetical protein
VSAPLALEGIEFRYVRPEKGGVAQLFLVTSDLRMAHCRVVTEGEANPIFLSYGSLELNRSELLSSPWPNIRWNFDGAAKVVVNESLLAGAEPFFLHAYAKRDQPHDLDVRIRRSTLVGEYAIMDWRVEQVQPRPKEGHKPIRIQASESVFLLNNSEHMMLAVNCNVAGAYQDAAAAKALLRQTMSWTEERNLYPQERLLGLLDQKSGSLLPGDGYVCAHVDHWCKFWGIPPTKSIQGAARFQGAAAGMTERLRTNIQSLTPADFRLIKGSPGQGVSPGGKDLGADVDNVGPGEAYERWKKRQAR